MFVGWVHAAIYIYVYTWRHVDMSTRIPYINDQTFISRNNFVCVFSAKCAQTEANAASASSSQKTHPMCARSQCGLTILFTASPPLLRVAQLLMAGLKPNKRREARQDIHSALYAILVMRSFLFSVSRRRRRWFVRICTFITRSFAKAEDATRGAVAFVYFGI